MHSKAQPEAGFTLLEMLVVIVLTATFMCIVITLPLASLRHTEQPAEVAARFSTWLDQQKGNSIYTSDPLRMCFQSHQIVMQRYQQDTWLDSQARFSIPKSIEAVPDSSGLSQDHAQPCFLLAFNTLIPAGHVSFGPGPKVDISWGASGDNL